MPRRSTVINPVLPCRPKISLELDPKVHARLMAEASHRGISGMALVRNWIAESLDKAEATRKAPVLGESA